MRLERTVRGASLLERRRPLVDVRTAALMGAMVLGFPLLIWLHAATVLPAWAAMVLGTAVMNLSFTAWHEPAHGNFSRWSRVNDAAGFVASLASVYPGYFARRREHLLHHRFQGVEGMDPVYRRVQATAWTFPLALLSANFAGSPLRVPATVLPMTPRQRWSDGASNVLALGIAVGAAATGWLPSLFWAWLLPRALVFWLHAYYICFFPHSVSGGGYEVYRVRARRAWLRLLTLDQSLHGVHHRWPYIPWHRYGAVLRGARPEIEAAGIRLD